MSRGNPEVEAMLTAGIPYCSMPEALMRFFMAPRKRAVVVGTHGKTTTSAMLSWVLHETGGDPSFMVGGAVRNFPQNFRLGSGPWFVAEGDEYDTAFFDKGPKFLHYDPDALLLNAIEFDHADIYRDLDHVKSAFRTLLERLRPTAVVAASADFPGGARRRRGERARRVYFGTARATWRAEIVATTARRRASRSSARTALAAPRCRSRAR
jgi:UDP-N-acetylmuramate: L-alanyl-gamma-D-glutamyl-meso-diaminopimelate ligase